MKHFELPKSMGPGRIICAYGANEGLNTEDLDRRDIVILHKDGNSAAQVVDKHPKLTRYMMYLAVPGFLGFATVKTLEELEETPRYFTFQFQSTETQTYVSRLDVNGNHFKDNHFDQELILAALNYSLMTENVDSVPLLFRRYASIRVSTPSKDAKPPYGVQCEYKEGFETINYGQGLHLQEANEHAGILPIRYYSDKYGALHVLARVEAHTRNSHSVHNYILFPLRLGESDRIVVPEKVIVVTEHSTLSGFPEVQSTDIRKRVGLFNKRHGTTSCIWGASPNTPIASEYNEKLVMFNCGEQLLGDYEGR